MVDCSAIRDSILKHMVDRTTIEHLRNLCVVTLPIRTVDGRLVDIFIEPRSGDYFLIHDAGKAANELILTGVNITPAIARNCERLAANFGVRWADETFQATRKAGHLDPAILGVAMCSSLATIHLLDHVADVEENALRVQLGTALKTWSKKRARIREHVPIAGQWKQHSFDFVAYPNGEEPIAISILNPAGNSIVAADRAALRARDMEGTQFAKWRRVAIETRAETWTGPAKNLLAKCSDVVIELNSGDIPTVDTISESLTSLIKAA